MAGEIIAEYGRDPLFFGRLPRATHSRAERNMSCGEHIEIDLVVENGTISKMGFVAEGRMVLLAAASVLLEALEDQPLKKAEDIQPSTVLGLLDVPKLSPRRLQSACLPMLCLWNMSRISRGASVLDFGDLPPT